MTIQLPMGRGDRSQRFAPPTKAVSSNRLNTSLGLTSAGGVTPLGVNSQDSGLFLYE